ncbi:uncharacterized protein CANTADRAFT_50407 [Suhomyces tanzawaensis NRRL Y-17324]|uniref:Uncharacterized protein n=1 Tax=Suhomyces tanzawaensis NRRL Y-17324 TaxID=984487 RepID=A0A1E4SJT4_9ASCO|nr:uncharacterized protein CANTADRAFT_50407 [Suhomyces tanzawaensis NRRL Y-17324]ODV79764.1 hypothetical protein CANTADRAFT_50407 [Suhomyces tanzawaensis NRRL Y-17324]
MSSHSDLIKQSKETQSKQLKYSLAHQKQLTETLKALVRSNSATEDPSSLIDKISTIHQLDADIDKQLNTGIATSFGELVSTRRKVEKLIDKFTGELNGNKTNTIIDDFQSRAELIDQELRILENTLKLAKK